MASRAWTIPGSDGLPIEGDAHAPDGSPRGVALIVHGFKGYKDYGMLPALGAALAGAGVVAHRFNLSHSGMTRATATFARPGLFERDTWNRQVEDVRAVARAVRGGVLEGAGLPLLLVGHSRGGVACLLAAGRHPGELSPAGVVTINAPCVCCSLTSAERERLMDRGFLETASARTGQTLRIGAAWLREQLDDPGAHDVALVASRIGCPALVLHGDADTTVDPASASVIARAAGAGARAVLIPGADHVLNTPNPHPEGGPAPGALAAAIAEIVAFAGIVGVR